MPPVKFTQRELETVHAVIQSGFSSSIDWSALAEEASFKTPKLARDKFALVKKKIVGGSNTTKFTARESEVLTAGLKFMKAGSVDWEKVASIGKFKTAKLARDKWALVKNKIAHQSCNETAAGDGRTKIGDSDMQLDDHGVSIDGDAHKQDDGDRVNDTKMLDISKKRKRVTEEADVPWAKKRERSIVPTLRQHHAAGADADVDKTKFKSEDVDGPVTSHIKTGEAKQDQGLLGNSCDDNGIGALDDMMGEHFFDAVRHQTDLEDWGVSPFEF